MSQPVHHLAAILFTDIVGYTAMMQQDEQIAVTVNKRYVTVLKQSVSSHGGEILNDYGDGSLCTFSSATQAVRCAMDIQQQLQKEPKVPLRIGIHIGEIFIEDDKVFGDGVNVASRIQSIGIGNSILFSSEINSKLKNQQEFKSISVGRFHFKNVDEPMEVFALANEGLAVPRKEEMSGKLKEIQKKPARQKWIIVIAVVTAIIAGFFIYQNFFRASNSSSAEKSIAVLPFENTGGENSEEYISDGITQDIINNLSKISSLQKVIGWFSVKGFKKTVKTAKQIANELGVTSILTGTIQKQADNIHIFAELIDVSTGERLWGNAYNYSLKDILSIQTELATQIVDALKAKLTPEEEKGLSKHYTENVDAYRLYRKGRSFWDARSRDSFDSAEANYKKALQLDPDYALAYAGLADCYIYNQKSLSQLEAVPIARDYAMKALSLDSNLSEALTTLAWIQSAFDYDWTKSKITLEKAIRLNPNYPIAHMYYGNLLQYTGESTEQGIKEVKRALELDPVSVSINWVLGRNYWLARRYDLAYAQLKKTISLDPRYYSAKANLVFVVLERKNFNEAFELIKQIPLKSKWEWQGPYLCYTYAVMGDTIRAKKELMKTIKEFPDQSPFNLARCNIILKNYSLAMDELDQAYIEKNLGIYAFLKTDPTLDPIRNEPRFKALLKKAGLK